MNLAFLVLVYLLGFILLRKKNYGSFPAYGTVACLSDFITTFFGRLFVGFICSLHVSGNVFYASVDLKNCNVKLSCV